ncbi:hypothetical protein HWV01_06620 [Moritella sp. 5]|uniref:FimV/HubP family polar landmark protein n=1 Tax=Moritella sp. 5 TaxID=2746231 RepID=UPI001BA84B04|nr:FimV/HubP family polar landmark protein [Moritella sp. 5]QUM79995.1 hypothetical protein HWV01_06620 [Moritella sp. 5]
MISGLSKLKWIVLFLLIPMAGIAANSNGFVLQLKGPEVYTPSSPNRYGPIVKADTLWSVATATRPDSRLSLYKTMTAIFTLNPHAFLGGDINKMIDGSFLKIPSAAEIQATDGSALKNALTKKSVAKTKSTPPSNSAKPSTKVIVSNKIQRDKLALLQGELTESNEHLLLSSETNRRLKLQLESIRMELAELKEQMAIDNALKADLKALIEQQNTRISEQQVTIDNAKNKAVMEAESYNNWWLIGGVSGVFSLLFLVWLGLWLKNRNDQKNNIEDSVMFDADNTVDELSDYLNTESFASDSAMSMPEEVKAPAGKPADKESTFAAGNLEVPDFNLQLDAEDTVFLDEPNDLPMDPIITKPAAPIMPEIIDQAPVIPALNDNDFSDIDLTLDDESTSFENDSVAPDLSWREELDEPSLIPDDPTNNKNTLDADLAEVDSMLEQFKLSNSQATGAPISEPVTESSPVVNDEFVNMDDIDSILAEAELEAIAQADDVVPSIVSDVPDVNQVVDMEDIDKLLAEAGLDDIAQADVEVNLPQAQGQTVDEMLAELDGTVSEAPETINKSDNADEPLDDIEAMLAEFSPNAFSAAPSEQPPIDVAAAQAEEFIDIDKLLNESSQQPANIEDEPYDKVKLDVGLDEYTNSLLDSNAVDIDDDNNRFGAQLDLARAYLEIEDKDGAKSILGPLAGIGDSVQQAEVNKLLSRL